VDVGQAETTALILEGQTLVVNPHQVQKGCVEVVNMNAVADEVVTEVVGLATGDARLDPAAGHPCGEAAWMMISAVVVLGENSLRV